MRVCALWSMGGSCLPRHDGRTWNIRLPVSARSVRLVSRAWVPSHMLPERIDTRDLGVAISGLRVDGRSLSLDDSILCFGWHEPEPKWRWTNGDAGLALTGARTLAFDVAMTGTYWESADGYETSSHVGKVNGV